MGQRLQCSFCRGHGEDSRLLNITPAFTYIYLAQCASVPASPTDPLLPSQSTQHNALALSLDLAHCIQQRSRKARRCVPQGRHPHSNVYDEARERTQERLEWFDTAFGTGNSGYYSRSATKSASYETKWLQGHSAQYVAMYAPVLQNGALTLCLCHP